MNPGGGRQDSNPHVSDSRAELLLPEVHIVLQFLSTVASGRHCCALHLHLPSVYLIEINHSVNLGHWDNSLHQICCVWLGLSFRGRSLNTHTLFWGFAYWLEVSPTTRRQLLCPHLVDTNSAWVEATRDPLSSTLTSSKLNKQNDNDTFKFNSMF